MIAEEFKQNFSPGLRISVRGEDFLIRDFVDNFNKSKILTTEGISEVVKSKIFIFDNHCPVMLQMEMEFYKFTIV